MNVLDIPLLLASRSPRRRALLEQAGFTFRVHPADVDESFPNDMSVRLVAPYLSRRKAEAVLDEIQAGEVILAADSTVVLGDTIFNKPADREDAVATLRTLSGQAHEVITGCTIANREKIHTFSASSKVFFAELKDEEIAYYVDTCKPFDKAGSYGIQEWIGLCRIYRIEGSYNNIVGLPVARIYRELETF